MTKHLAADADTIDLADVASSVRRGWSRVLVGIVAGALIAGVMILFVPPRFGATASVVIRPQEGSAASLASKLGSSLPAAASGLLSGSGAMPASPIETELQILSSRALAGEIVDSLLLQLRMHSSRRTAPWVAFAAASFPGSFKRRSFHFQRTSDGSFTVSGSTGPTTARAGKPVAVEGGSFTLGSAPLPESFDVDVYDREEAVTRFQKRFGVSKPGGEVLALSFSADDSLTAAAVPNLMIRRYLERRRTTDRGINERRVEFLGAQVDSVEQSLASAEHALRAEQERSGVVDPVVVGKLELERAGELRKETGTLDVERGAIGQLLSQLAAGQLTSRQLAAFPTFLKSPGINDLLGQLSTLETKRLQLLATLTPADPAVIATTDAIKNLEGQLPPLARAYAASLDRQRADVGRQLDTLRSAIEQLPATSESALRRQRDVLRLGQVSAALRAQLVDAKLAAIGEGGDVRLLDTAEPPRKVSFPTPGATLAAGMGGGAALGILFAILGGFYGRYVNDAKTIERQIGIPALSLDVGTPFLVASPGGARTLLLVPLDSHADTAGVAERLMRTASSRGLRGTIVDLSSAVGSVPLAPDIERTGADFDLVVVRVPELSSDATVGALRETRPVLLVASADRVDRRALTAAVDNLQRLSVPCAGVVLSRQNGKPLLRS